METIYTIPVNEAFEACMEDHTAGCPFCKLSKDLEEREIDLILGASMMEPDVRIKTNEMGFCRRHFDQMFTAKNRLGFALMLESMLAEQKKRIFEGLGKGADKEIRGIEKFDNSCYVCSRVEASFSKMIQNAVLLWEADEAFRGKLKAQPYFCLPHYKRFLEAAKDRLNKKRFAEFYEAISGVETGYYASLEEDVSWFCKKFDYRYKDEPWNNAKDAVERSMNFIAGADVLPNPKK